MTILWLCERIRVLRHFVPSLASMIVVSAAYTANDSNVIFDQERSRVWNPTSRHRLTDIDPRRHNFLALGEYEFAISVTLSSRNVQLQTCRSRDHFGRRTISRMLTGFAPIGLRDARAAVGL